MAHNGNWKRLLLLIGVGVDLLLFGYMAYLLWDSGFGVIEAQANPSPTPTRASVDLWDAYGEARAAAQAQAEDATCVSASTQWQSASEDVLLDGASNWAFVFYSPASGRSFDVTVNAGRAHVVNQTQEWVAPGVMAEAAWEKGPKEALLVFLACGGRAFLDAHPQAVVDVHLGRSDDGSAVWTVVALDAENRAVLSLQVDAETRQVLSNQLNQYAGGVK